MRREGGTADDNHFELQHPGNGTGERCFENVALTPMMQQYLDLKKQYPDELLMFRLGDFYELFFEDAVTASRCLEITLTGRDAGPQGRVPMCGVPHHAVQQYLERLMEQGFRVAICEQLEDPKVAKGLVKRDVVRVVTPGTWIREGVAETNFLAAFVQVNDVWAAALADLSTGEVNYSQGDAPGSLKTFLTQWQPREVLIFDDMELDLPGLTQWAEQNGAVLTHKASAVHGFSTAGEVLLRQYHVESLETLGIRENSLTALALAAVLGYIEDTQRQTLCHFKFPRNLSNQGHMAMDPVAQRHLEVFETLRSRQRKGSLYHLLNQTATAMGARLLRQWLDWPLQDSAEINQRLDALEGLVNNLFARSALQSALREIYDLERILAKVSFGSGTARDLVMLSHSLQVVPEIRARVDEGRLPWLETLWSQTPELVPLVEKMVHFLVDDPPVGLHDGGIIRSGVDEELDQLRELKAGGTQWLADLEKRERDRTGIRSLKVGYNKVFGYYLEVSKANLAAVPEEYERRQTLAAAERYVIPELKEMEARVLQAEERALQREYELFAQLRADVLASVADIQAIAGVLAVTDVVTALASVAANHGYVRPVIHQGRGIHIVDGRHPMVEDANPGRFVPNDTNLSEGQNLVLLTGPNMAGKSTYMRQVALIVLMAHMGSFVPARAAKIGRIDRIFTRIGASDDLSAGQSTFMVEMVELAQILHQATERSLVLLDEIGRGTSTYDGMSIAEAVLETLQSSGMQPLTLFATHYHELSETVERLSGATNCSVAVEETETGIAFLHTVVPRPADRSYGIQVARLAGIPDIVIDRAMELLQLREQVRQPGRAVVSKVKTPSRPRDRKPHHLPLTGEIEPLFVAPYYALTERLAGTDVNQCTPLEALNLLDELVKQAQGVVAWDKFK